MKAIRGMVRSWKREQFSQHMRQLMERKVELLELMSGSVPSGRDKLKPYQNKRRLFWKNGCGEKNLERGG